MKLKYSKTNVPFILLVSFFSFFINSIASAEETTIVIRAQAKDAKFIGSSIGGALVIVKDQLTGKILAEGLTRGSTGNTEIIMQQPQNRGKKLSNENTAAFEATIDIDKPVFVTIEVYAPVTAKQATVVSSTQLWLLPGKDIIGDGIIIEVPGFVVDILSPQTHETIIGKSEEIVIKANVVMMCGCPINKEGLWDANKYEIEAVLYKNGKKFKTVPLEIQEKPSTFINQIPLEEGNYEIQVYAFDPATGNTGLDRVNIIVK